MPFNWFVSCYSTALAATATTIIVDAKMLWSFEAPPDVVTEQAAFVGRRSSRL